MRAKRSLAAAALLFCAGCVSPGAGGQPHPDLDVELVIQMMADLDYFLTNYGWLLAGIGL